MMGSGSKPTPNKPRGPQEFAPLPKGTVKQTFNDMERNATRHSCVQCTMFDTHGDHMNKPCAIANHLLPTRTLIRVPIAGNPPISRNRCWPLRHLSVRMNLAGATRTMPFARNPNVITKQRQRAHGQPKRTTDAVFCSTDLLRQRTQKRITHTRNR